jgi:hypothetical protein
MKRTHRRRRRKKSKGSNALAWVFIIVFIVVWVKSVIDEMRQPSSSGVHKHAFVSPTGSEYAR